MCNVSRGGRKQRERPFDRLEAATRGTLIVADRRVHRPSFAPPPLRSPPHPSGCIIVPSCYLGDHYVSLRYVRGVVACTRRASVHPGSSMTMTKRSVSHAIPCRRSRCRDREKPITYRVSFYTTSLDRWIDLRMQLHAACNFL